MANLFDYPICHCHVSTSLLTTTRILSWTLITFHWSFVSIERPYLLVSLNLNLLEKVAFQWNPHISHEICAFHLKCAYFMDFTHFNLKRKTTCRLRIPFWLLFLKSLMYPKERYGQFSKSGWSSDEMSIVK